MNDILTRQQLEDKLKESEDRCHAILESAVDILIIIDDKGIIEIFNATAEKVFGYSREDVIGRNVKMLMPEPYHNEHDSYIENYKKTGMGKIIGIGREVVAKRRDGTTFPIDLAVSEFRAGSQRKFLGIIRDITERKRTEEELKVAILAAESANKAKGEFLANMSHEIRTPMNTIIGMTELALDTELTEEQRRYLKSVLSSSETLLYLINDILDFSKTEAGHIKIEAVDFNLTEVVERVVETMSISARNKGIELINYIDPDLNVLLKGDPNRLRQIIINLIGNAIKFTDEGEVIIKVEEALIPSPSNNTILLHFSVSDTGIGISKENQGLLFKKFSQVDGSSVRRFGGTGLGLSISKSLIELMGGEISVESEEGSGSTFHFYLPFDKQEVKNGRDEFALPETMLNRSDIRILIAEDNIDNQNLAKTILQKAGYNTEIAENGRIAFDSFRNVNYDLILMDVQMPEVDGFEASRNIRQFEKEQGLKRVPIIALTAHTMEGYREECLKNGMDDYITKPLKKIILLDTVDKWLENRNGEYI